jgi:hypothetical protein
MCKSYVPDVINRKNLTKNKFYSHYLPMNQLLNCVMQFLYEDAFIYKKGFNHYWNKPLIYCFFFKSCQLHNRGSF